MKQKHTPEPNWSQEPWHPDENPLGPKQGYPQPMSILPARDYERARLCVNACAGLNPEFIPLLIKVAKDKAANHKIYRGSKEYPCICDFCDALRVVERKP